MAALQRSRECPLLGTINRPIAADEDRSVLADERMGMQCARVGRDEYDSQ
jgi:hypothetical protein